MNIYFKTFVGDELKNNISEEEFKSIVTNILNDDFGWKQYGYNFIYGDDKTNLLKIYLRSGDETNKICKGLPGLSCTRFKKEYVPIDITINYNNWIGGSKSTLSIDDYQRYVINHEVGHWLGLDHTECPIEECKKRGYKNCPASIMQQMSKGPKHVSPCIESCRPLSKDWKIDDPKKSKYRFINGSGKSKYKFSNEKKIYIIILIILTFIIILIIPIFIYKKTLLHHDRSNNGENSI